MKFWPVFKHLNAMASAMCPGEIIVCWLRQGFRVEEALIHPGTGLSVASLAMELAADDISVSSIHPGVIDTAIVHNPAMLGLKAEQLEKLQKYYRDEGVHPRVVAADIVKGVLNKSGTVRSGKGTFGLALMKRILPRKVFRKMILKAAREMGYSS